MVPIAPATAEAMSDLGRVMTRAVKVEALNPCSDPTMKYASSARAVPSSGRKPVSWYRKPGTRSRDGSGSTGSWPERSLANAASADGAKAVKARACSTVGGHGRSWVAPQAETAVRSACVHGLWPSWVGLGAPSGLLRERVRSGGDGSGSQSPVHSRFATAGYVPCSTRSPMR